jgi:hypothetical protein
MSKPPKFKATLYMREGQKKFAIEREYWERFTQICKHRKISRSAMLREIVIYFVNNETLPPVQLEDAGDEMCHCGSSEFTQHICDYCGGYEPRR